MKDFIKLTSRAINKLHVIQIVKKTNLYEIHMSHNKINGEFLWGSGTIDTNPTIIEICEKKDKEDYDAFIRYLREE
jgi:hypothetical protein